MRAGNYQIRYFIVLFWIPLKGHYDVGLGAGEQTFTCWASVVTANSTTRHITFSWYYDNTHQFAYGISETNNDKYSWQ